MKYEKMFESGNRAQLEQMIENDHKEGWEDIDILFAIMEIADRTAPCKQAYYKHKYEELRRKASDISNFAHMIILKCDKKLKL